MAIRVERLPPVIFLVFGDAITGMIGVLLVALVLARPPSEEPVQLEQADLRLRCASVVRDAGGPPRARLLAAEDDTLIALGAVLSDYHDRGSLSVRLLIERTALDSRDERTCLRLLREEVDLNNAAYERPGLRGVPARTPYVFLTTVFAPHGGEG